MDGQSRYFSAVPRIAAVCSTVVLVWVAACRASQPESPPATEGARPFAGYAVRRLVLTPTGHVRAADSLGWVEQLGGPRSVARRFDTLVVRVLDARGIARRWVLPEELVRAYERNRTYATDPYQLVWEPVRSPSFKTGERYGEPLSSQLRTMIALHDETRYLLLPVELRFERVAEGATGRGVLRATIVDARTTEAMWVGDVRGDTASAPATALASVATKLADLFAAP